MVIFFGLLSCLKKTVIEMLSLELSLCLEPLPSALSCHNISDNRRDIPMVNCTWLINIHEEVTKKLLCSHFVSVSNQLQTRPVFEFSVIFSLKSWIRCTGKYNMYILNFKHVRTFWEQKSHLDHYFYPRNN